ncbi:MAG: glycoside hydrolase family 104 protein [Elusimicrobiota bacterium]|nr:glycoside hydrolase family 104 protein [Elusimicrobiota bacterium]
MRKTFAAALTAFITLAAPLCASAQAFDELLRANGADNTVSSPLPAVQLVRADGLTEAEQYLPPNNNEPGFEWPGENKGTEEHFVYIGKDAAFLRLSEADDGTLSEGSGKCALAPQTLYKASAKPGFKGEHMIVDLAAPLPGCQFTRGYIYMMYVSSSSAGGAWELPRNVRAFLDTLAYAEGTTDAYNYIFTHATFESYADHPRKRKCAGKLCSDAAGRYQFLSRTWDGLAPDLGLADFTPPSQDKAAVEIFRRAGAYNVVLRSSDYKNFASALGKLNNIWASLPGSPYGQPTHTAARLWSVYKAALAKH